MRPRRTACRTLARLVPAILLLAVPAAAPGQVAHPMLAFGLQEPLAPTVLQHEGELVPDNPAATLWGFPALAYARARVREAHLAAADPAATRDYRGNGVGFAMNEPRTFSYGLAFERLRLDSTRDDYHATAYNVAGGGTILGSLAWGVGVNHAEVETLRWRDERSTLLVGGSYPLFRYLFLGAAFGREYLGREYGDATSFGSQRSEQKYGVAFANQPLLFKGRGPPVTWHLEYSAVIRTPHADPAGFAFDKEWLRRSVVELDIPFIPPALYLLISWQRTAYQVDRITGVSRVLNIGLGASRALHLSFFRGATTADDGEGDPARFEAKGLWLSVILVP
jgi:hypothetical protein